MMRFVALGDDTNSLLDVIPQQHLENHSGYRRTCRHSRRVQQEHTCAALRLWRSATRAMTGSSRSWCGSVPHSNLSGANDTFRVRPASVSVQRILRSSETGNSEKTKKCDLKKIQLKFKKIKQNRKNY